MSDQRQVQRGALLGAVILGALIAFPLGILASHRFTDVPDSNSYHADIDALADAGVTTGCGDGTTFCPSAFVTREQMAAFMNRLGALAAGKTPVVNAAKLDGLDSTKFVRSDVETFGTAECGAAAAAPSSSTVAWALSDNAIYATSATNVIFRCEVSLPDGATITQVRWQVFDSSATDFVSCLLLRVSLGGSGAYASASTGAGATPLGTTLTDSTWGGGLVDNSARMGVDSRRSLRHPSARALPDGLAPEAPALRTPPSAPDVPRQHAHTAKRVLVAMLCNVHETVFTASLREAVPRQRHSALLVRAVRNTTLRLPTRKAGRPDRDRCPSRPRRGLCETKSSTFTATADVSIMSQRW
jgi:hypothetical protein